MIFTFKALVSELYNTEPELLLETHREFSRVVRETYAMRPGPTTSQAVEERLDRAATWFRRFKNELHWSRQRAYEYLADAVVADLDGVPYEAPRVDKKSWKPKEQLVWMPS